MAGAAGDIRVRVLGWIHLVLGAGGLVGGGLICLGLARTPGDRALDYVGPLFMLLATVYFAPCLLSGWSLLAGKSWGRVVAFVVSALLAMLFPIGTALGAFGVWTVFTTRPQPVVRRPGSRRRGGLLGLLAVAGVVACGFVVTIGLGYRVNHQATPPIVDQAFKPALVLLFGLLGLLLIKRPLGAPTAQRPMNPFTLNRRRRDLARHAGEVRAEQQARLAALEADPARRRFAALIRQGDYWSDEQIAYALDAARAETCPHLAPIEKAMRAAGLTLRPVAEGMVRADCRVNEAALLAAFEPPICVNYHEYSQGGRAAEDFPVAQIDCTDHRSVIQVIHALEAKPDTPWFPAPPSP